MQNRIWKEKNEKKGRWKIYKIKGWESQSFKSRSMIKVFWNETWKDYKRVWNVSILKFKKKMDLFSESYKVLKILIQSWFVEHFVFTWTFLNLQLCGLINNKRIHLWKKIQVIWMCIERNMTIWNFNFRLKVSFFWKWYVFMVIVNRVETLKRHWNIEKKFEIILYLGPSLKLVQKNVEISHLIKPKDQNFDDSK